MIPADTSTFQRGSLYQKRTPSLSRPTTPDACAEPTGGQSGPLHPLGRQILAESRGGSSCLHSPFSSQDKPVLWPSSEIRKKIRKSRRKKQHQADLRLTSSSTTTTTPRQPRYQPLPGESPLGLYREDKPANLPVGELETKEHGDVLGHDKREQLDGDIPPDWGGSTEEENLQPSASAHSWPWGEAGRPSDRGESAGVLAQKPPEPAGDPLPRHQSHPRGQDRPKGESTADPKCGMEKCATCPSTHGKKSCEKRAKLMGERKGRNISPRCNFVSFPGSSMATAAALQKTEYCLRGSLSFRCELFWARQPPSVQLVQGDTVPVILASF